uniref:Uncharacterized protein n=1 Tax=Takifugu rubripes TaxID=31033 RepID=A0A674PQU1_TAKRU
MHVRILRITGLHTANWNNNLQCQYGVCWEIWMALRSRGFQKGKVSGVMQLCLIHHSWALMPNSGFLQERRKTPIYTCGIRIFNSQPLVPLLSGFLRLRPTLSAASPLFPGPSVPHRFLQVVAGQLAVLGVVVENRAQLKMCPSFNSLRRLELKHRLQAVHTEPDFRRAGRSKMLRKAEKGEIPALRGLYV